MNSYVQKLETFFLFTATVGKIKKNKFPFIWKRQTNKICLKGK